MVNRNEQKLRGLMGLCVRARQATFGEDGCLKSIRGGGCGILLLCGRASEATREKYRGACENAGVPLALLPPGLLGEATGKPGVAMAVMKGGLAQQIRQCLSEKPKGVTNESEDHGGGASV